MTGDHAAFDELAVGWAMHALEPEDESSFAAHLAGCARCTATVTETSELMAAMAGDLPEHEPSEGLRNRIRAAVEATEQLPVPASVPAARAVRPVADAAPETRRVVAHRSRWRRALPVGLVAAAVAAIVGLGLWNVVLTSDRQELQATIAEQSEVMAGLMAPGTETIAPLEHEGRSVATVVTRGDEVDVISHGLPVNDADSTTYVLWGMGAETAQPLGTFDVTGPQMEMETVGSGLTGFDQYDTFGISLEPGQKAPSLPTEVVATGQVTS
jgi:hypothetical protein